MNKYNKRKLPHILLGQPHQNHLQLKSIIFAGMKPSRAQYILLFCLSFQLSVLPQILGLQNEILKEDVSAPFQPETGGEIF
ncbi:MAG: hypothetical protein LBK45_07255, partial [Tannerellaceae bacterium]|nr:hypothetical protein [Tannerellaceae bacterium]